MGLDKRMDKSSVELDGRPLAVVTGGAAGIGQAIVRRLVDDGFGVVSIDKAPTQSGQAHVHTVQADLLDASELADVATCLRGFSPDLLVNNAGVALLGPCDTLSVEVVRTSMALNLEVPLVLMQAVVPGMREKEYGRLVNITSRAALGKPLRTAYAASKGGLVSMTRTWALELAASGITANCVAPGPIATQMFAGANPDDAALTRSLLRQVPVGRLGTPDDIAQAVSFLADRRSGFVTGQTLYVCGGLSIGASG